MNNDVRSKPVVPNPASATPGISLVVATLNRTAPLEAFLCSLPSGDLTGVEVIVVDQNPDERLVPILGRFRAGLPLCHLRTPTHGANRARNLGARAAHYDWLAFPDDDCLYYPGTLPAARERMRMDVAVALVGDIVDPQNPPRSVRMHERTFTAHSLLFEPNESALFVRREALLAVEGFDERFGPGALFPAAEGADLITRLFLADPAAVVRRTSTIRIAHPGKGPPWNAEAAVRMYNQGVGFGGLVGKHPFLHRLVHALARCAQYRLATLLVYRGWKREAYRRWLAGYAYGSTMMRCVRSGRVHDDVGPMGDHA